MSAEAASVAGVVIDSPLPHLDRIFEYAIPAELLADAQPGVRVKVRFSGRDVDGFIVELRRSPEHPGRLSPLRKVVSPEPVLTAEVAALCRWVARHYAGPLSDVLRLAIPKRHAGAEKALPLLPTEGTPQGAPESAPAGTPEGAPASESSAWSTYPAGPALLRRLAEGAAPRAAWSAMPAAPDDADWPDALAEAARVTLSGGRGSLLVVPDHRDLDRLDRALTRVLGAGRHVRLDASQGQQARYTAWLKVLRGHVHVAIGTRAAMFAPVRNLGLVAWWDDGDDLYVEPRAPYPQVGTVLLHRAQVTGAGAISGGFARSVSVAAALARGDLVSIAPAESTIRAAGPRVSLAGDDRAADRDSPAARAQLPPMAYRAAREALEHGPVLIQVPRRGYQPSLRCAHCRTLVRCVRCAGPLSQGARGARPVCRTCGQPAPPRFECRECGSPRVAAGVLGAARTAEDLGRAFPGIPILTSAGLPASKATSSNPADEQGVRASVDGVPKVVVATPGAEPVAAGGYAAVLLLDAWALLDLPITEATSETVRRWMNAAALSRPGAPVVIGGIPPGPPLLASEALVRWDPGWLAERELAERVELRLPPAAALAKLIGPRGALSEALAELDLPGQWEVIGPSRRIQRAPRSDAAGDAGADAVALVRAPLADRDRLAEILLAMRAVRSARKEPAAISVTLDPVDIL